MKKKKPIKLKRNNLENLKKIQKYNVKDVLLIGGTGYLGIHILYEYLKYENGKIYCLVRRKNNEEPLIRLQQKIAFIMKKIKIEFKLSKGI